MAASAARTWKLQEFAAHESNVNCLALGHISGRVLVTGGDDKKVNLWAIGNKGCVLSLTAHATPVECVKFGHTEEFVCAGSQAGELNIWNLEANKKMRTFIGHKDAIKCIDFHPYGDFLTSGSLDTSIKLWDLRRKGCISNYKGHELTVNSVQFSPDGLWIASGGEDNVIKLWDVRIGRQLREFKHHRGPILTVEFHPHEFLLVSSSLDKTIAFWDLENFNMVSHADNNSGPVRCLYFSQEGECLFGGVEDCLKVFGWEPGRTLNTVNVGWGVVQDIVKNSNQLIGASSYKSNVLLYGVDMSSVKTKDDTCSVVTGSSSPFKHGQSTRRSFSKERLSTSPVNKNKLMHNMMGKTVEESDKSGTDEETVQSRLTTSSPFLAQRSHSSLAHRLNSPTSESEPVSLSSLEHARQPSPRESRKATTAATVVTSPSQPRREQVRRGSLVKEDNNHHTSSSSSGSQTASPKRKQLTRLNSLKDSNSDNKTDYPLRMNNIRHSPSEPALNRPQPRMRKSSLSQTTSQLNGPGYDNCQQSEITPRLTVHRQQQQARGSKPVVPVRLNQSMSPQVEFFTPPTVQLFTPTPAEYYTPPQSVSKLDMEDKIIPMSSDCPSGLDLNDFMPRNNRNMLGMSGSYTPGGYRNMSEAEGLSSVLLEHNSVVTVLRTRQRSLQIIYSMWQNKDTRAAVDSAVAMNDSAVVVDLLGVLVLRPTIWNLDLCGSLLPQIADLLQSKYEMYMTIGCTALTLILRNFLHIIKTNVQAPIHSVGVDISREERYNKCLKCYNSLMSIRAFLLKKQTMQGKLGHSFRELSILMQGLD